MICIFCYRCFETKKSLDSHTYQCKDNPNRSLKMSYDHLHTVEMKIKSATAKLGIPLTDTHKNNVSVGRKKFLSENPEKHPWRNTEKFKSIPCEKVKVFLKSKNIKFEEEFQPLNDRFFSIDIALPTLKIGIEINGNQHYDKKTGNLKNYYQNRHDLIEQSWLGIGRVTIFRLF